MLRKDIITRTSIAEGSTEYSQSVWDKKCYLMGLDSSDEENNPNVVQTIGWNSAFGGMGSFDPLSETPVTTKNVAKVKSNK